MPATENAVAGFSTRLTGRPRLSNLHHEIDIASRPRRNASRSVLDKGTTAKLPPGLGDPEWWRDLEYVWRLRTYADVQRLTARGRACRKEARSLDEYGGQLADAERQRLAKSASWAEDRARAMAMERADVVSACGTRKRKIACGCGIVEIDVGCDQPTLCERCRKRHWRRWRKRITRTMDAHLRAAVGQWQRDRIGYKPGIYLLTFTMPHSGSIVEDRAKMGRAWHELGKRSAGWWGTFALAWEVTPGTAGDGHVHMHVAAISQWIPYAELAAAWAHVMPGAIQPDVVSPKDARERAQRRGHRYDPAGSAAYYLAKYVTKGVDPVSFTGRKAGELIVAFRGKRKVSTSLHFWRPLRDRDTRCRVCGREHRALGRPPGLKEHSPGAWFKAMANRVSWWGQDRLMRHSEQCPIPIPALIPPN